MTVRRQQLLTVLLLAIGVWGWWAMAEAATDATPRTDTSTSSTIYPVLNSTANDQNKAGSLIIGPTTAAGNPAQFCLNPVAGAAIDGSNPNCVASWSDPRLVAGNHVRLGGDLLALRDQAGGYVTTALSADAYQRDQGYVGIQAQNQSFTTIIRAPEVGICVFRDPDPQIPGQCFGSGSDCYANSDCGYVGTALYAAGGSGGSGRAGYFTGGSVLVTATAFNERYSSSTGRICLGASIESPVNDLTGGACISSWNEITSLATAPYVRLQQSNNPGPQSGGGVITGAAMFSAAVVGDYTGINPNRTCGDGICTAGETAASCAVDCGSVPAVTAFSANVRLNSTIVAPIVDLSATITAQAPSGSSVHLVVVRSTSSTLNWRPTNGVTYTTGTIDAATTIVRAAQETQGAVVTFTDTLPNQTTTQTQYYYFAFQGNPYPVYGAAQSPTVGIRVAQVTTTANYPNIVTLKGGSGATLLCNNSICTGLYQMNTTDTISINTIANGYSIQSWTGCSSSTSTSCTLTTSTNRSVTITLSDSGGDPGGDPGDPGDPGGIVPF